MTAMTMTDDSLNTTQQPSTAFNSPQHSSTVEAESEMKMDLSNSLLAVWLVRRAIGRGFGPGFGLDYGPGFGPVIYGCSVARRS